MNLLAIAQSLRDLANKARDGSLSPDEVARASFTITSLASFDIDAFTPIIDPPQIAILGVGRVVEKAAVSEGEIAKRSMMYLSLTFDHRATDGAPAGRFLQAIKRNLEKPG
jgi:pyruvate dehydrogenase E2 component (dihydrolipoamide acetyltransferase)